MAKARAAIYKNIDLGIVRRAKRRAGAGVVLVILRGSRFRQGLQRGRQKGFGRLATPRPRRRSAVLASRRLAPTRVGQSTPAAANGFE